MKLSLQSMQDRYHYREHGISTNIVPLKSYLQGETDEQGVLAVKVDVFNYMYNYRKTFVIIDSQFH